MTHHSSTAASTESSRAIRTSWRRRSAVGLAAGLLAVSAAGVADAGGSSGMEVGVGFFYGTFGESPNQFLVVGGAAEDFCIDNPDDPFNAEPGSATAQARVANDGTVHSRLQPSMQPVFVYAADVEGAPPWINQVCAAYDADGTVPTPLASGEGLLRGNVHVVPDGPPISIFNEVTGFVSSDDGTTWRVRASADIDFVDGVPIGDPPDFVSYELREIGR